MDLGVSGLASGFDWRALVEQLIDVERAPQRRMRTEQLSIISTNTAYGNLKSQLAALKTKADAIKDASLFDTRNTSVSNSDLAQASASSGTAMGTYSFVVSQVAKAASFRGAGNAGGALSATTDVSGVVLSSAGFAQTITAGTITVDGKQVTIATTDTLQQVFDNINTATSGAVTGSYDAVNDKIVLTKGSGELIIGSSADTSNFLQAARLTNEGGSSSTSAMALGSIRLDAALSAANFGTALTAGSGEFKVNGASITWDSTDKVSDVLTRINNSSAGVNATYDFTQDRFVLTSKSTGDVGVVVEEVSGGFVASAKLNSGALTRGQDLLYTVNGGASLRSRSNTITADSSGLQGLSVEFLDLTATTNQSFSVTVGSDTSKIKTAVNDFITEYNKTQSLIDTQTAVSTDSKGKVTAGVLASQNDVEDIASQMRNFVSGEVAGLTTALKRLEDIGIVSNGTDNKIALSNATKLDTALASNLNAVKELFANSTTGLAVSLSTYLDKTVGEEGSLVARQTSLTNQSTSLDTQMTDLERYLTSQRQSMMDRFLNMELAQSKINQQMSYLQKNLGL